MKISGNQNQKYFYLFNCRWMSLFIDSYTEVENFLEVSDVRIEFFNN